MRISKKLSVATVLLLGAGAAQATPITWTDTTGLNASVYTTEYVYQSEIQNGLIPQTTNQSLILLLGDQGLISFIERLTGALRADFLKSCSGWSATCRKQTVPEPGALTLLGLGFVGVALAIRRTRKMRGAAANA